MQNRDKQLLGFLSIALAAVLAIYLSAIPQRGNDVADDALLAELVKISPAAGDSAVRDVCNTRTDAQDVSADFSAANACPANGAEAIPVESGIYGPVAPPPN